MLAISAGASLGLTEEDLQLIAHLERRLAFTRPLALMLDNYYRGTQPMRDLGISLPPQMVGLQTVIDWPSVCVDAVEERLDVEGFRYPSASDGDEALWDLWQANDLDEESGLAHRDSLVFGHSYVTVGNNPESGSPPLITVESPLSMVAIWDQRTRSVKAALRIYRDIDQMYATLYTPDRTIQLERDAISYAWETTEIDDHELGAVPVVRMANRQRIYDRTGSSEITPAVRSITDAACRTLLGAEVAREFYGAPQRYILGADETAFQDETGKAKTAWETYTGRVLALERDEDGNLPEVGQFTPYDPSVYTALIDMYAKVMAAQTGLPPHYLGYASDNPTSADAIRSSESRLVKRAERRQRAFGGTWEQVMRLALLVQGQELPEGAQKLETIWRNASTPTVAQTADAAFKYVQAGVLPATSTVTLEMAGFSDSEIIRIQSDRSRDQGESMLSEIASSLIAKEARTIGSIDKAVKPDDTGPPSGAPANK
jgi:hypothetical protein